MRRNLSAIRASLLVFDDVTTEEPIAHDEVGLHGTGGTDTDLLMGALAEGDE